MVFFISNKSATVPLWSSGASVFVFTLCLRVSFMDRLLELLELCVNLVSNLFHLLFRELQLGVREEHVLL